MKAAAPPALVSHGKKNGKPHGAKGQSSALALSSGKGKTSFLSLMSARAALAGKKPELPVSLDNPRLLLLKVALAAAFDGRKAPVGATATGVQQQAAAGAQAQLEKTDLRKRTGRLHSADSLAAGLTLTGPASTPGAQKTVDVNKRDMAADATAMPGSAKTGTAHHASPLVRVVDLRTKVDTEDSTAARTVGGTAAADKDAGVPFAQRLAGTRNAPADPPQKAVPAAPSQAQTAFERLQDMAGSELLRATNLVLKDGGGEIRLVLKPDSLGSVRIRMNLVDNAIEGRIIVDSSSVKQVVDGSIDALRRALTAEGFQTGSLQVSVGGQNADTGSRQEQQPPQAIRRITAQGFDRNVPGVENIGLEDLLVNLFV